MPTPSTGGFARYNVPDPTTQAALQGIQNLIAQLKASIDAPVGPGAGNYILSPALTPGGVPASITLDSSGRVLAIVRAT
jgi:hypothetical protein